MRIKYWKLNNLRQRKNQMIPHCLTVDISTVQVFPQEKRFVVSNSVNIRVHKKENVVRVQQHTHSCCELTKIMIRKIHSPELWKYKRENEAYFFLDPSRRASQLFLKDLQTQNWNVWAELWNSCRDSSTRAATAGKVRDTKAFLPCLPDPDLRSSLYSKHIGQMAHTKKHCSCLGCSITETRNANTFILAAQLKTMWAINLLKR